MNDCLGALIAVLLVPRLIVMGVSLYVLLKDKYLNH